MRIVDLPAVERPRERLLSHGPGALCDRELVALLLGTGSANGGAHRLGEQLLNRYGSIAALARAHPAELTQVPGVGPAKAAVLVAAAELGRRLHRPISPMAITTTADLVAAASTLLRAQPRERLVLVVCDNARQVIATEVVSEGAAGSVLLPVREIIVATLRRDGSAFGLAHNHPSGDLRPSAADVDGTAAVAQAAATTGLRFLDHVIVTDGGWSAVPVPTVG